MAFIISINPYATKREYRSRRRDDWKSTLSFSLLRSLFKVAQKCKLGREFIWPLNPRRIHKSIQDASFLSLNLSDSAELAQQGESVENLATK